MNYYKDKIILITGAASGIGEALTNELICAEAKLILVDINESKLKALKQSNPSVEIFPIDITDEAKMNNLAHRIWEEMKIKIDIIVACAGVGGVNLSKNFSLAINRKMFEINYFGTVNTIIPHIKFIQKYQKRTQIVGISSLASFRGLSNAASYCASKSAQAIFLESLRVDFKKDGIIVTTVFPGFVDTPMANHNLFSTPFKISANKCAIKILKAVSAKKNYVYLPRMMYYLAVINRWLPASIFIYFQNKFSSDANITESKIF